MYLKLENVRINEAWIDHKRIKQKKSLQLKAMLVFINHIMKTFNIVQICIMLETSPVQYVCMGGVPAIYGAVTLKRIMWGRQTTNETTSDLRILD